MAEVIARGVRIRLFHLHRKQAVLKICLSEPSGNVALFFIDFVSYDLNAFMFRREADTIIKLSGIKNH